MQTGTQRNGGQGQGGSESFRNRDGGKLKQEIQVSTQGTDEDTGGGGVRPSGGANIQVRFLTEMASGSSSAEIPNVLCT